MIINIVYHDTAVLMALVLQLNLLCLVSTSLFMYVTLFELFDVIIDNFRVYIICDRFNNFSHNLWRSV